MKEDSVLKKWNLLNIDEKGRGKIFRHESRRYASPNGSKVGDFDVLHFSSWVNVIALTSEKKMLLISQFRAGTEEVTLELPGGAMDPGEQTLVAAQRELAEETGYQSDDWEPLTRVTANPAFMSNDCTTYLARGAQKMGGQNLDPLEEIEIHEFSIEQVWQMLQSGRIHHSLIVAALMTFFATKEELRR
jgi:ADP-ribose pyrophosphatase